MLTWLQTGLRLIVQGFVARTRALSHGPTPAETRRGPR
ncbi:MAG: hypothetical protein JWR51_4451 [Devosia sp.]|nr:hypothetical protein [Devosia sp.]